MAKLHGKAKTAFLRRMARGRNKGKHRKKGRKRHMAKRRRSRKSRKSYRRRSGGGFRRRRRSGGGGGGGGGKGLSALKNDAPTLVCAGVYGMLESKAKADDSFILNKVPKPLAQVGYTGNIALALYAATFLTRNKWVRLGSRVVGTIALYKLGRNGGAFTDAKTISGDDELSGDEQVIEGHVMGALDAEGTEPGDTSHDLPYDDVVRQAESRV